MAERREGRPGGDRREHEEHGEAEHAERGEQEDRTGDRKGRVEADVVRFEVVRLPSGMYRHSPAKFVFELTRR